MNKVELVIELVDSSLYALQFFDVSFCHLNEELCEIEISILHFKYPMVENKVKNLIGKPFELVNLVRRSRELQKAILIFKSVSKFRAEDREYFKNLDIETTEKVSNNYPSAH